MSKSPAWDIFSIKSYTNVGDVVQYEIFMAEEPVAKHRFSDFEALGKDLEQVGVGIDWKQFPSKMTMFAKKDNAFYTQRKTELESFMRELLKAAILKDNLTAQAKLKSFLSIESKQGLVEYIVNFGQAQEQKKREELHKIAEQKRQEEKERAYKDAKTRELWERTMCSYDKLMPLAIKKGKEKFLEKQRIKNQLLERLRYPVVGEVGRNTCLFDYQEKEVSMRPNKSNDSFTNEKN